MPELAALRYVKIVLCRLLKLAERRTYVYARGLIISMWSAAAEYPDVSKYSNKRHISINGVVVNDQKHNQYPSTPRLGDKEKKLKLGACDVDRFAVAIF